MEVQTWCCPSSFSAAIRDPEAPAADDQDRKGRDQLSTLLQIVSDGSDATGEVLRGDSDDFRALQFSAASPGSPGQDICGKIGCCYLNHTIVNDQTVSLRKLIIRKAPVLFYDNSPNSLSLPDELYAKEQCVLVKLRMSLVRQPD